MNNMASFITPSSGELCERKRRAAAVSAEDWIRRIYREDIPMRTRRFGSHIKHRRSRKAVQAALQGLSTVQGSFLEAEKNVPRRFATPSASQSASNLFQCEFENLQQDSQYWTEFGSQPADVLPRPRRESEKCWSYSSSDCDRMDAFPSTDVSPSFVYSRSYKSYRWSPWRVDPVPPDWSPQVAIKDSAAGLVNQVSNYSSSSDDTVHAAHIARKLEFPDGTQQVICPTNHATNVRAIDTTTSIPNSVDALPCTSLHEDKQTQVEAGAVDGCPSQHHWNQSIDFLSSMCLKWRQAVDAVNNMKKSGKYLPVIHHLHNV